MSQQIQTQENNETSPTIIKVLGVGGGGSNAVKHMFNHGITNVDFFICNTDAQALEKNSIENKIQIGSELTEGRGAGNNPEIGKKAADESREIIKNLLGAETKMLFITAGMGGGTGTGAAPIIAEIAREMGILTIGIVTIPFNFEGKVRLKQAITGVEEIEKNVDSLLVINNEKLRKIHGDLKISEAFANADEVLAVAVKGIAEIITVHGQVNVDFADVETVMRDSGVAIMGSATATGENRGMHAIKKALNSPLLNSSDIQGAKNVLLNVSSGSEEFRLDELGEITDYVQSSVKEDVQIIWGNGNDKSLDEKIRVVIIATGFMKHDIHDIFAEEKKQTDKEVIVLDDKSEGNKTTIKTSSYEDYEEEEIESGQAIYAQEIEKENLILEDPVKETEMIFTPSQTVTKEDVAKKEIKKEELIFKETIFEDIPQIKKKSTLEENRKKVLQGNITKKNKKSTGKIIGDWIQTSLDSMFTEEVH